MDLQPQNKTILLVQEEPRGPSQLIEIPIATATTSFALPDVQQLRSQQGQVIIIKAIRLVTIKVLSNAPVSGNANAPVTELRKISLVLYAEGWMKGYQIPLLELNDVADADSAVATTIPYRNRTTRFDNWTNVDWSKSILQFSNGTVAVPTYSILLDVEYIKLDAQNKEIIGPS